MEINFIIFSTFLSVLKITDEIMKSMQIRDTFVGQNEQFIVGLLQDGHSFAVDFQFFSVESNLGLATFFHVALELINHFVFLLMTLIFSLDGLHIGAVIGFLDLFL